MKEKKDGRNMTGTRYHSQMHTICCTPPGTDTVTQISSSIDDGAADVADPADLVRHA